MGSSTMAMKRLLSPSPSRGGEAVLALVLAEGEVYHLLKGGDGVHLAAAEVETYHRVRLPPPVGGGDEEPGLLYAVVGGECLEELAPPEEDGLEGGAQQRLAEAARAVEKIGLALGDHLVDEGCLVHIHVAVHADALEALYAYRVFSL